MMRVTSAKVLKAIEYIADKTGGAYRAQAGGSYLKESGTRYIAAVQQIIYDSSIGENRAALAFFLGVMDGYGILTGEWADWREALDTDEYAKHFNDGRHDARAMKRHTSREKEQTTMPEPTTPTLSQLLAADGVTITPELIAMGTDSTGWVHREYRVTIAYDGRTYTQTVKHGGEEGDAPELVETVGTLVRQSMTAYASEGYEDWASDFATDPADWMPEETYTENVQMAEDLRALFGADRFERYAMADHDD